MIGIQMEFNINNDSEIQTEIHYMQKQIKEMHESMNKVRKKLFSEMSEIKKICLSLQSENQELKQFLKEMRNEKTEWVYEKNDCLFEMQEYRQATG